MGHKTLAVVLVALALCGGGALSGCGGSPGAETAGLSADYPSYSSPAALVQAADVVVVGQVVATETRDINISLDEDRDANPAVMKYLVSSVKVGKVLKGDLSKGDVIEVKQLLEGEGTGVALKDHGTSGVLFLAAYPYDIPYSPLNPWQGVLPLTGGKKAPRAENGLFRAGIDQVELISQLEALAQ